MVVVKIRLLDVKIGVFDVCKRFFLGDMGILEYGRGRARRCYILVGVRLRERVKIYLFKEF